MMHGKKDDRLKGKSDMLKRDVYKRQAASLKRGAESAGGEGRCIRLSADKLFAGEFHDHAAVACGRNKAVVLFCGHTGHRLEPMSEVGGALLDCPILHCVGYDRRHIYVKAATVSDLSLIHI